MIRIKKITIYIAFILIGFSFTGRVQSQIMWIGVDGSSVYSWFSSPKLDELTGEKDIITYSGWGWNIGPFIRYGRRPFVFLKASWTRTYSELVIDDPGDEVYFSEDIKLDNFNFTTKIGYELLQLPMFKIDAHAGLFIGKAMLFSGESIYFDTGDFERPQWGMTTGIGFQFTNLVFGLDYNYHFSQLFKPIELDGQNYEVGSKLQTVSFKVGVMF
jgi:hypothetical protein